MSPKPIFRSVATGFAVFLVVLFILPPGLSARAEAVKVDLAQKDAGWQLMRGGKAFFIQGAGGTGSLEKLKEAGGNCVRTWGVDGNTRRLLDQAERVGVGVCLGVWLGHERHGFDYGNVRKVQEQFDQAKQAVMEYKDHPALVLWGVGNEMEGFGKGDNESIWRAVDRIAEMIHEVDPQHPAMTAVAELGGARVESIHRFCPHVDIVGINSYGGISTVPQRYRKAGGTKPYLITEFGPVGWWETRKTDWGAPIEPTSTEKADIYRAGWTRAVEAERGKLCLGGFAFLWGHKQEGTATWFGMFLPDGAKLAPVDAMTELWSGKPPANRCPAIERMDVQPEASLKPGVEFRARLSAADPDGDEWTTKWVLQEEPRTQPAGGDFQGSPPVHEEAILDSTHDCVTIKMPETGGDYRLFAYVHDGNGGAATANMPFRCTGPVRPSFGLKTELPLIVYDGETDRTSYVPSGWMGNTQAISMKADETSDPQTGQRCLKMDLRRVRTALTWVVEGHDELIVFYLDEIRFE